MELNEIIEEINDLSDEDIYELISHCNALLNARETDIEYRCKRKKILVLRMLFN